jgi:ceramide glucosyltransferase
VWIAYIFLGVAIAGTISSNVFLVLAILGAVKFHRDARGQRLAAEGVATWPSVSLLKPVHGLEARLKENLESFFHQDYPDYEILFAADREDNEALAVVRGICARYPQVRTQLVVTGPPQWLNPPAYSFHHMAGLAKHDILVTSDSDVEVQPNYLREVVAPLLYTQVGMRWGVLVSGPRHRYVGGDDRGGSYRELAGGNEIRAGTHDCGPEGRARENRWVPRPG